jgi:arylsulfatase A-like enzyme
MRSQRSRRPGRPIASRRLLAPALAALAIGGALAVAGPGPPPATLGQAGGSQVRPNIVVVETDDQTFESLRVMRNVKSLIGAGGATFLRSFVNQALCCPSRATFMTGQYMHNHRVLSNNGPNGGFRRFQALHAENNLAVWLRRAGYYTAMFGRYLNGYAFRPLVPPGWSEWRVGANQKVYGYTLDENGTLVKYGTQPAAYKQNVLTGKAVNLISRRAPRVRPFFLWLNYPAPHISEPPNPNPPRDCRAAATPAPRHAHAFDTEPLPSRPNFNERSVADKPAAIRARERLTASQIADIRRKYRCELESLLSVDQGVARIVAALRAKGELRNTVLIYTSDNGYFHGEHRIPQYKQHIYEESIRVPLLIRGPGIPAAVRIRRLAVNADLAPTIVDLANARAGLRMDGRSLIPVVNNPGIGRGRQLLIEEPSFAAIRNGRYMYAEHRTGERELYDLRKDPYELRSRDRASAYASVKRRLAGRLDRLRGCAGSGCRLHSGR